MSAEQTPSPARLSGDHPDAYVFSHRAMGTTFRIHAFGDPPLYAAQACAEAFALLDRIENELSRYVPHSDVSRLARAHPGIPVRVGEHTFECLAIAARIHVDSGGAFDVTVGALMDGLRGSDAAPHALRDALSRTGMHLLALDRAAHTVTAAAAGMQIDLGGIGKGYALDRLAELLSAWDITRALLVAEGSTMRALEAPPSSPAGWPMALGPADDPVATLDLRRGAVSGSGLRKGRHIVDPRTGRAIAGPRSAWSRADTAALADALSTAFMIMEPAQIRRYAAARPNTGALVVCEDAKRPTVRVGF